VSVCLRDVKHDLLTSRKVKMAELHHFDAFPMIRVRIAGGTVESYG
jgi:hypothetical protein